MLALSRNFIQHFKALWTAYEMQDLKLADRRLQGQLGEPGLPKLYILLLLADRIEWLLGGSEKHVADA